MIIKNITPSVDIAYEYIWSIDKNDYAICIYKKMWNKTYRLICDLYDKDWLFEEIIWLDNSDWIDIIPAYEIKDCPTLKWFYIVRNN